MSSAPPIRWRVHLRSSPEVVFRFLVEDEGRATFWAESAVRTGDAILFVFPDGTSERAQMLESRSPSRFVLRYFGATTTFELTSDGAGGTDLTLTADGVPDDEREEVLAGWVSVLLALKAAADHGVDLRNHDANRSWAGGYADN